MGIFDGGFGLNLVACRGLMRESRFFDMGKEQCPVEGVCNVINVLFTPKEISTLYEIN